MGSMGRSWETMGRLLVGRPLRTVPSTGREPVGSVVRTLLRSGMAAAALAEPLALPDREVSIPPRTGRLLAGTAPRTWLMIGRAVAEEPPRTLPTSGSWPAGTAEVRPLTRDRAEVGRELRRLLTMGRPAEDRP